MSENEANTTVQSPDNNKDGTAPLNLLAVATRQRAILMTLLIYILVIIGARFIPVIRANEPLIMIVVSLAIIFFAARLCWVLYGKVSASLLTVLCCIPYVNIIILLMVSSRSTKILKEKGFKVGLLGAKIKDVAAYS